MDIYNTELLTAYDMKKQKDKFQSFAASSESVKYLFKQQTLKQPKLAIMDSVAQVVYSNEFPKKTCDWVYEN